MGYLASYFEQTATVRRDGTPDGWGGITAGTSVEVPCSYREVDEEVNINGAAVRVRLRATIAADVVVAVGDKLLCAASTEPFVIKRLTPAYDGLSGAPDGQHVEAS